MPRPTPPSERSSRARSAALARLAQVGGDVVSAPARAAFDRRFEDQVDPDCELPDAERKRRAEFAKRRYFVDLGRKSGQARRRRVESMLDKAEADLDALEAQLDDATSVAEREVADSEVEAGDDAVTTDHRDETGRRRVS